MWFIWRRRRREKNLYETLDVKTLEDLGIDGRIILQLILKKQDKWVCAGLMWLRIGTSGVCFEHIRECSI
jgi:hypothetical protein